MKLIAIIFVGLLLSGCGTMFNAMWWDSDCAVTPYGGAMTDLYLVGKSVTDKDTSLLYMPLGIIDFPLSTVADTMFLPMTIPKAVKCSSKEKKIAKIKEHQDHKFDKTPESPNSIHETKSK